MGLTQGGARSWRAGRRLHREINRVAAQQQRRTRDDLLGRSVAETLPEVVRSGILGSYVRCIDTGEPLILDDLAYYGRTLTAPNGKTTATNCAGSAWVPSTSA